ncbi:MAG TPA: MFS transporter [Actinophytocola sp.]|jgi:MFS family permease|nr:MFS transporter [Actinophytocola sp.]
MSEPRRSLAARLLPETGPQRAISLATFVNTFGFGIFLTVGALYFTQLVHLSTALYAAGLFAGSIVGLLVGLVAGQVADRVGARETQMVVKLSGAIGMVCYLFVTEFWQFVLVSAFVGIATGAHGPCQSPLIRAYGGENPVAFRAYQRSLTNLAVAFGVLVAGVAIAVGTPFAYQVVIAVRAGAYLVCILALTRVPHLRPTSRGRLERRWLALRDLPYLTATTLNALMGIHFVIPSLLLPLWIAGHTTAPRSIVSVGLILNTAIVVCLQVRASRGVADPASAGTRMRWAGLAIGAGIGLLALAHGPSIVVATALVLIGVAVYTLGELWHAAAAMEYEYGLAAAHAQGQYSGVFALGQGLSQAVAPMIVGAVGLSHGVPGLLTLGLAFVVIGAVSKPLLRVVLRTPESAPV